MYSNFAGDVAVREASDQECEGAHVNLVDLDLPDLNQNHVSNL